MTICKEDMVQELVEYELEHLTVSEMVNMIGSFLTLGYSEMDDDALQEQYNRLGASDHAIH